MVDKDMLERLQRELETQEKTAGLSMTDILAYSEPLRGLVKWLVRNSESKLSDVAAYMEQDDDAARSILTKLMEKGWVRPVETEGEEPRYRICLSTQRKRQHSNILEILD